MEDRDGRRGTGAQSSPGPRPATTSSSAVDHPPRQPYQNIQLTGGGAEANGGHTEAYQNITLNNTRGPKKESFCSIEEAPRPPPGVPGKKCSRSVSQISRLSGTSGSSCPSHHSDPKNSYDEVSLSTNFNKPVIEPKEQLASSPKVDDIFALSAVSFGSPLADVSPGKRGGVEASLAEEASMTSVSSTASSFLHTSHFATNPTATIQPHDHSEDDDLYEDIEEIQRKLRHIGGKAPEPPPRNSILKPETLYDRHERQAEENLYSDLDTSGESSKDSGVKNLNLMDAVMAREEELFSDVSDEEHEYEVTDGPELGARPKTNGTIDIRSKISQWYEEAEKEVERDLALDISALDSCVPVVKRRPPRDQYEHVSLAFAGRPVGSDGEVVPRPTVTLLRDFDPCHLAEEARVEASNAMYGRTDLPRLKDETSKNPDFKSQASPLTSTSSPPAPKPRQNVRAAKKINFGPPKPPRNFNYAPLEKEEEEEDAQMCEKPIKAGSSDKSLEKRGAVGKVVEHLGDFGRLRGSRRKERKDSLKGEVEERRDAAENLYVALPLLQAQGDTSDASTPEDSPRPPSVPPPPLPASSPPPAGRRGARTTMYENCWVEPELGTAGLCSSPLPPVPARPSRTSSDRSVHDSPADKAQLEAPSKTLLLDARFQGRKASQESLSCHGSPFKARSHTKSESIDSGSSASSYSITSESPTLPGDFGASSEAIDGRASSPSKPKLKKFANNRSFSVANLGPKLTKLPEMATNIRRRMSNQFAQGSGQVARHHKEGEMQEAAAIFPDTPDNSDHEVDEVTRKPDLLTQVKRNSFVVSEAMKPGTKTQAGALFILSRSKKAFQCKWCILGKGNLKWFNEDTSLAIPKETILLSNVFSVTKRQEVSLGPSQQELFCFDLSVLNSKGKFCVYQLGALTSHERETWLERLVQSLSHRLSTFSMVQCYRLGWAYIKLGFAAEWSLSWLSLSNQYLRYTTLDGPDMEDINLKKTKDLFIRNSKESQNLCLPQGFSKHPVLVCDFNDRSLYILCGAEKECTAWKTRIQEVAFNNNNVLREQQVTHEDIPVIVDKCVKFVYSHGVMTEGIYRLAGGNTKINRLLTAFRSNAWAVQISREEYSEHDVANVLKRFVRQLSEPLLTETLRDDFLKAADMQEEPEKLERYRQLLGKMPAINYNTLRRLMGHLHTVADQCDKNLMPVINLSPLWGPNITTVDGQEGSGQFGQTSGEMESFHAMGGVSTAICADFLTHYPTLFNVDVEEVEKEKRMLEVLEKINFPTPTSMKRSGDIRMWIYIESRTSGDCVSLVLHPSLTAGDALRQAGEEAGLTGARLEAMHVHEVVLGGALERPLHHSEKLLDVTLRWGSWPETDRHDNYLLLKSSLFYQEALPCALPPLSVMAEVQFSDCRASKGKFLPYLFSVSKAAITYYREEKTGIPTELGAWPVEEMSWYLGSEPKRGAPYNLNITFILKSEEVRSKEHPLFGRIMSFSSRELFVKWIAALLVAEHQADLLPPAPLLTLT